MNYYAQMAAILCVSLASGTSLADEVRTANLAQKYIPGKVYYTTQSTNTIVAMTPSIEMNTLMLMNIKNESKAHQKGVEMAISYEGMSMKMKVVGNLMAEYDSGREDNDPTLAEQLDPLLRTKFSAIYSKKGEYLGTEGLDELKLDPKTGITRDTLESMVKQGTMLLPNREVKVGESWRCEVKLPMAGVGKMEISFDVKLVSVDNSKGSDVAKIQFTGMIKPFTIENNGQTAKISSKKITGIIMFDLSIQQASSTEITMELITESDGQKQSVTSVTKHTLTRVEDSK